MSKVILDKDIYNEVNAAKLYNENVIADLYSNFNNYTMDEKQSAIEIIYNLKIINDEYEKYIIIYNSQINQSKRTNEYISCEGDTWQSIAQRQTGDYNNWKKIMEFNNITDIYLESGVSIKIPLSLLQ